MGGMQVSHKQIIEKARADKKQLDRRLDITRKCIALLEEIAEVSTDTPTDTVIVKSLSNLMVVQLLQLKLSLTEGAEQSLLIEDYLKRADSPLAIPSLIPPGSRS